MFLDKVSVNRILCKESLDVSIFSEKGLNIFKFFDLAIRGISWIPSKKARPKTVRLCLWVSA